VVKHVEILENDKRRRLTVLNDINQYLNTMNILNSKENKRESCTSTNDSLILLNDSYLSEKNNDGSNPGHKDDGVYDVTHNQSKKYCIEKVTNISRTD